jgi:non-ribosomal peptide synthase protein (TIGR01720 family)
LARLQVTVPVEVTSGLLTVVPVAFHAGVDDVLLAGLGAAVGEWLRGRGVDGGGVLVDVEGHGRGSTVEGVELSRTVGWFTGSYPVRVDPGVVSFGEVRAGGPAAGRVLKRVKEVLRAVPGDGLGWGMLRYLNPQTAPQLAALPKAQIGFNYLGRLPVTATDPAQQRDWSPTGQAGTAGTGEGLPVMHALEVMGVVHDRPEGSELALSLAWPEHLLTESAARALLDGWAAMLTGMVEHVSRPESGGGHSPSDFSLITIDQTQIDELETGLADEWSAR